MDPDLAGVDSMSGEEAREWWQLAYVSQFCYVFRPAFSFPEFIVEDLEDALVKPGENGSCEWKLICDIHVRMLRGIFPNRGVNVENWQLYLRKLLKGKAKRSRAPSIPEGENVESNSPESNADSAEQADGESSAPVDEINNVQADDGPWNPLAEDTDYRSISIRDKVTILYLLCEMRLDVGDVYDSLKGWEGNYLRMNSIGEDRHGNRYWYLDSGLRLYKESTPESDPIPPEEEKPKPVKPVKKGKAKRGRGRPKKATTPPVEKSYSRGKRSSFRKALNKMSSQPGSESETETIDDDEPEPEPALAPFPPTLALDTALLGEWSIVADTQEEWTDLTQRFVRSRNASERELGKFIESEVLEEVIRRKTLREKQQRKKQMLENMPRRASGRITIMKVAREEEERMAEHRREVMELERRHAEEERQKKLLESRRELRDQRVQARVEAAEAQGHSPPAVPRNGPPYGITEEKYDAMYAVLDGVRRTNHAWLFEEPVSDEIAPNYSLIVKRPMAISTAEQKLDEYLYRHPTEFIEDLRVMCSNCRLYNGPKSQYFKMADLTEAALKRHVAKHFPRIEWGEPPQLPPSDPLPPAPKPQKRKSLGDGSADSPPRVKVKSSHHSYPTTPVDLQSEGASPEPVNTSLSRQQPVASHAQHPAKDFVNSNGHSAPPTAAATRLQFGAIRHQGPTAVNHHPSALVAGQQQNVGVAQPGLGAWGAVIRHPPAMHPAAPYQPAWSAGSWPGARPTLLGSAPPMQGHVQQRMHMPQNVRAQHSANGHAMASPGRSASLQNSLASSPEHVVSPSTSTNNVYRMAPSTGSPSPNSMPVHPASSIGRQSAFQAPSSVTTNGQKPSPGRSALQHASRPLSAVPVPCAPVAASVSRTAAPGNLHSMSRPLSAAGISAASRLTHPATIPDHSPAIFNPAAGGNGLRSPAGHPPVTNAQSSAAQPADSSSQTAQVQTTGSAMGSQPLPMAQGASVAATNKPLEPTVSGAPPEKQPVVAAAAVSRGVSSSSAASGASVSSSLHIATDSSSYADSPVGSPPAGVMASSSAFSTVPSSRPTDTGTLASGSGIVTAASVGNYPVNSYEGFNTIGGMDALDQLATISAQASPVISPTKMLSDAAEKSVPASINPIKLLSDVAEKATATVTGSGTMLAGGRAEPSELQGSEIPAVSTSSAADPVVKFSPVSAQS